MKLQLGITYVLTIRVQFLRIVTLYFNGSVIFTKADIFKQHPCIKFCVNVRKYAVDTLEILHQTFGEYSFHRIFKIISIVAFQGWSSVTSR